MDFYWAYSIFVIYMCIAGIVHSRMPVKAYSIGLFLAWLLNVVFLQNNPHEHGYSLSLVYATMHAMFGVFFILNLLFNGAMWIVIALILTLVSFYFHFCFIMGEDHTPITVHAYMIHIGVTYSLELLLVLFAWTSWGQWWPKKYAPIKIDYTDIKKAEKELRAEEEAAIKDS